MSKDFFTIFTMQRAISIIQLQAASAVPVMLNMGIALRGRVGIDRQPAVNALAEFRRTIQSKQLKIVIHTDTNTPAVAAAGSAFTALAREQGVILRNFNA